MVSAYDMIADSIESLVNKKEFKIDKFNLFLSALSEDNDFVLTESQKNGIRGSAELFLFFVSLRNRVRSGRGRLT